jgi:antagonist of KipI
MADVEALEILMPGPLTSVQDLGRFGYARYGVPPSGAVDPVSLRIGNLLVGNREGEAGLEITLYGFKARALCDLRIAVTGGDLQPRLLDKPLPMWRSVPMGKGEVISLSGAKTGLRAYLTVGGGIRVPVVLGSRSTNLGSGFGGLGGRPLQRGDILWVDGAGRPPQPERSFDPSEIMKGAGSGHWDLRVLWGPQDDHFPDASRDLLLDTPYQVTSQSDRTGIRLKGPALGARASVEASIMSEGVIAGALQVPGDGQPIILLGETVTGGYRKIATVISADLFRLGQIRPGDAIRFWRVSHHEALEALEHLETAIGSVRNGVFP